MKDLKIIIPIRVVIQTRNVFATDVSLSFTWMSSKLRTLDFAIETTNFERICRYNIECGPLTYGS